MRSNIGKTRSQNYETCTVVKVITSIRSSWLRHLQFLQEKLTITTMTAVTPSREMFLWSVKGGEVLENPGAKSWYQCPQQKLSVPRPRLLSSP